MAPQDIRAVVAQLLAAARPVPARTARPVAAPCPVAIPTAAGIPLTFVGNGLLGRRMRVVA